MQICRAQFIKYENMFMYFRKLQIKNKIPMKNYQFFLDGFGFDSVLLIFANLLMFLQWNRTQKGFFKLVPTVVKLLIWDKNSQSVVKQKR